MKLWPLCILALAVAAQAEDGWWLEKDKQYNQYFEVETTKQEYPKGYTGWLNYTAVVTCENGTFGGRDIFPYEEVEYILGVETGPVMEELARGNFIYVPGDCCLSLSGRYYVTPTMENLTLVHVFKPEHQPLTAKKYEFHKSIYTEITPWWSVFTQYLSNMFALSLLGLGVTFTVASLISFKTPVPKQASFALLFLSVTSFTMGFASMLTGWGL
jgi:hypothetical protein